MQNEKVIMFKKEFERTRKLFEVRDFETIIHIMLKVYLNAYESDNMIILRKAAGNLLKAYYIKGDYRKAFYYGGIILKLLDNIEIEPDRDVYLYMSLLYYELQEYSMAEHFCKKILAYESEMSPYECIEVHINLALIYSDIEQFDQAYEQLDEVSDLLDSIEQPAEVAVYYYNELVSEIASKTGQLQKAYNYLQKARISKICQDNEEVKIPCFIAAGLYYEAIKNFDEALKHYLQGYELAKKFNNKIYQRDFLIAIYRNRDSIADHKERLHIIETYINVLDEFQEINREINAFSLSKTFEKYEQKKELYTDYLTGIKNRAFIERYIEKHIENHEITCVLFDVDNFKDINDSAGHLVGDQALIYVAKTTEEFLEEHGIIARYGGDEFLGVFKGVSMSHVQHKMQKLLDQISQTTKVKGINNLTLSIGISNNKIHNCYTMKSLINMADCHMYKAKTNGKNQLWIDR